jgi:subtilisin family serine protease
MNTSRRAPLLALFLFVPLAATLADPATFGVARDRQVLLDRMNVPAWHQDGQRGKGIKVAVLDTGFHGYRDHLGKALPTTVTTRAFRHDGKLEARSSQHGILCGEVVHAVAPDADVLLANWETDQPGTFLDAVKWARQQGAKIITCSVIMPTWSDNEGHGAVHRELTKLLGDDCLFFAAAGNVAERHWAGTFAADAEQWHQWQPGRRDNRIVPWESERVSVEMMWQGDAHYRIVVLDGATGKPVAVGTEGRDSDHTWAAARFVPVIGQTYSVRVQKVSGDGGRFHLVALGATLEQSESKGSVSFPADGAEVVGVGAINADDQRMAYSACGTGGAPTKPDLVATVPFPSSWRERPFGGTSAAAPQAAALAAIIWSSHPGWPASRVREAITRAAHRLTDGDPTSETGFGQVRLPER